MYTTETCLEENDTIANICFTNTMFDLTFDRLRYIYSIYMFRYMYTCITYPQCYKIVMVSLSILLCFHGDRLTIVFNCKSE